jgi:hypothetical protein
MYEWGALWGNPGLGMAPPATRPLVILLPDGLPEFVEPGTPATFTVRIEDGGENYLQGSGTLNYRYDNGSFVTSNLVSLGDDLYEATLPAANCDAIPEYYITAISDQGTMVSNPPDAPNSFYTFSVGTLIETMSDNFETDLGWTVSGNALAGHWERGIPAGTGDRGDPLTDYDGSGQCYLTGNSPGDSDVDSGYTYLVSPSIDLEDVDEARIRYAIWYTNNVGDNPNYDIFRIYISSDNGANWELAETIGPASLNGWNERSFIASDFIDLTSQVKVRFEASDLNGGSVVEAAIDAFRVTKLECSGGDCQYVVGDINNSGGYNGLDVTYSVSYFKGGTAPIYTCECTPGNVWFVAGDVNAGCNFNGLDVTYGVAYLKGGPALIPCANCPPVN